MFVRFQCPACKNADQVELAATRTWNCSHCAHTQALTLPRLEAGQALSACVVCGNTQVFRQKNFPQWLGLSLLAFACASFFVLQLLYEPRWAWGILLGSALIDGRIHWFVAHLVARRSWWIGRVIAVMNAEWLGRWDLGPRAHPGDGLLDISDATLSFGDRLKARRRLPTGTHLPHPGIETDRVGAWQVELQPALDVWLDGERIARARNLSIRVEPEALTVVV